jgi:hypothetical protein
MGRVSSASKLSRFVDFANIENAALPLVCSAKPLNYNVIQVLCWPLVCVREKVGGLIGKIEPVRPSWQPKLFDELSYPLVVLNRGFKQQSQPTLLPPIGLPSVLGKDFDSFHEPVLPQRSEVRQWHKRKSRT